MLEVFKVYIQFITALFCHLRSLRRRSFQPTIISPLHPPRRRRLAFHRFLFIFFSTLSLIVIACIYLATHPARSAIASDKNDTLSSSFQLFCDNNQPHRLRSDVSERQVMRAHISRFKGKFNSSYLTPHILWGIMQHRIVYPKKHRRLSWNSFLRNHRVLIAGLSLPISSTQCFIPKNWKREKRKKPSKHNTVPRWRQANIHFIWKFSAWTLTRTRLYKICEEMWWRKNVWRKQNIS